MAWPLPMSSKICGFSGQPPVIFGMQPRMALESAVLGRLACLGADGTVAVTLRFPLSNVVSLLPYADRPRRLTDPSDIPVPPDGPASVFRETSLRRREAAHKSRSAVHNVMRRFQCSAIKATGECQVLGECSNARRGITYACKYGQMGFERGGHGTLNVLRTIA